MRHRTRAFTLVELLVVISIIALLVALTLPSLAAAKEAAKRVRCLSQVRQITLGAAAFNADHDGFLPVRNEHGGMWWGQFYGGFAIHGLSQTEWFISGLWTRNYVLDKNVMGCPSRFDHKTINPASNVVTNKMWNNFYSTYHAVGISGFMWDSGIYGGNTLVPLYLIRQEQHVPQHPLFIDATITTEPAGDWTQLHQTNHWNGLKPEGGNVTYADGSGRWLAFNNGAAWLGDGGHGAGPTGFGPVYGTHNAGGTYGPYYYNGWKSPKRGKLYVPPLP